MSWWRIGLIVFGPICLVASHIVGTWAISFIDWIWLVRPLTVGIVLAAVVAVAVFIVVRRLIPAALIADAIVLLFMGERQPHDRIIHCSCDAFSSLD